MEDDDDFQEEAEDDAKVDFKNEIPDEPLVPPAKPVSRF
jgi:hypothetical protein